MTLHDAQTLAVSLLREHHLWPAWHFRFDRSVRRFGVCNYRKQFIGLSSQLTQMNDEAHVRDTILHEIAHALCPIGTGHGFAWRAMARTIGAKPERCCANAEAPKGRWYAFCEHGCGYHGTVGRFRRGRLACKRCCRRHAGGRFDARFMLGWTTTPGPTAGQLEARSCP